MVSAAQHKFASEKTKMIVGALLSVIPSRADTITRVVMHSKTISVSRGCEIEMVVLNGRVHVDGHIIVRA